MSSTEERCYRQRGAPIIHDTIDNETIAINQQTGAYYSLEGAAALAWQRLASAASSATLVDLLAATYEGDRAEFDSSVDAFLKELLGEELIVAVDGSSTVGDGAPLPVVDKGVPFPGLSLQRYNDLEVMLLADPIHEVDETGWPMPLTDPPR